jgi:hypothetical protein
MIQILERALELIANAQKERINLRLLGGLAVKVHSINTMNKEPFLRDYDDIDFAVSTFQSRSLIKFFREQGLSENKRFNALNSQRRMIFFDGNEETGTKIDVFVGVFSMCHKIDFNNRLTVDDITIPLAELFLTKLQIVQINKKDITDVLGMLIEHEIGNKDYETINLDRIAKLCSVDWGLNHTIEKNIVKILQSIDNFNLSREEKENARLKLNNILLFIKQYPKSIRWRARSILGESIKWYEEPEDAIRDAIKLD